MPLYSISLGSYFDICSYLHLGLPPSDPFLTGFSTKILYVFLDSRHATYPHTKEFIQDKGDILFNKVL
jgi:hypothetical protein